jgi:hypothetical protein
VRGRRRVLAAGLAGLALCGRVAPAQEEPLPKPPTAGLAGLVCISELVHAGAEGETLELAATYAGDRARWLLTREVGGAVRRALHYRRGARFFHVPELATESEELIGAQAETALLGFELRRALIEWPGGFDWSGSGAVREAAIPGAPAEAALKLEARLGADGRPVEIAGWRGGERREVYRSIRWREEAGRWMPAEMELARDGRAIWRERVQSVDHRARFLDLFFMPPDRRGAPEPKVQLGRATMQELPPVVVRRYALEAKAWTAALGEARRLADAARKELGRYELELDPGADFELTPLGEPTHCVLRLAGEPERLPEGWTRWPKRQAGMMHVPGPPPLPPGTLEKLLASLPADAVAGTPYVRVPAIAAEPSAVQVVLPFEVR